MRIIKKLPELRRHIRRLKKQGKIIGFVPTMGALHEGHLSLIRRARRETDVVVVSIFINPIQFNRKADFQSYPRPVSRDARLAAEAGTDLLFVPQARAMYPPDFQTAVEVKALSRRWEGTARPGHFRGVTTVVTKLFHLVQPNIAYFGQKDAQQARVVEQLIQDLNFDVKLTVCPTAREATGLAMSSRNRLLSSEARRSSRVLFEALQEARRLIRYGEKRVPFVVGRMKRMIRKTPGIRVDYVVLVDPATLEPVRIIRKQVWALVSAWVGSVRLIDHATLPDQKPKAV